MKFMTPDLLARFRSEDDEVAEAAAAAWEEAGARYNEHLDAIRASLPRAARKLLRPQFNPHDARVLAVTVDETPFCSIFLKLAGAPDALDRHVELRYRLAGGPEVLTTTRHPALEADGQPFGWWLYDEFDVVREGQNSTFIHSILFTGGCELRIPFSALSIRRLYEVLLPSTPPGGEVVGGLNLLTV